MHEGSEEQFNILLRIESQIQFSSCNSSKHISIIQMIKATPLPIFPLPVPLVVVLVCCIPCCA